MIFLFVSTYGRGDYTNGGSLLLLFLYAILIVVLITVVAIVIGIFEYYEIHTLKFYKYFSDLSDERKKILGDQFSYYQKLSKNEKKLFKKRLHHFLVNKNFVSKELEITEEMKVLIAATAIQILFGLGPYYLSSFNTIELSSEEPKDDVSEKSKKVTICWPEFKSGIDNNTDGYNPGLKILSRAFNIEQQLNKYSSKMFNKHRLKELNQLYQRQAEKYIASGKSKYQDYKQIDRSEYFAIAVEYFFERPEHFYANQPEMYIALAKLLRQDVLGMYKFQRK